MTIIAKVPGLEGGDASLKPLRPFLSLFRETEFAVEP
jgi:hypothetical protein